MIFGIDLGTTFSSIAFGAEDGDGKTEDRTKKTFFHDSKYSFSLFDPSLALSN